MYWYRSSCQNISTITKFMNSVWIVPVRLNSIYQCDISKSELILYALSYYKTTFKCTSCDGELHLAAAKEEHCRSTLLGYESKKVFNIFANDRSGLTRLCKRKLRLVIVTLNWTCNFNKEHGWSILTNNNGYSKFGLKMHWQTSKKTGHSTWTQNRHWATLVWCNENVSLVQDNVGCNKTICWQVLK